MSTLYTQTGILLSILASLSSPLNAAIQFEETTQQAGITYVGESWGIAWGDFNGDGYPDIWSGNHRLHPSLYINNQDGTFTDILPDIFVGNPYADTHGAAWADFDNDGDQDLMEVTGGSTTTNINHYNHLYVNDNGNLIDQAGLFGVDYPQNRGRTPLWLDYNNDGLLDLVTAGAPRAGVGPSSIFKQTSNGFVDSSLETGFNCSNPSNIALLSDLNNDGNMDLICQQWLFPQKIYDLTTTTFSNITIPSLRDTFVYDAVIADFNGDLMPDIFTGRFPPEQSNSIIANQFTVESRVDTSDVSNGVRFQSSGNLNIDATVPYLKPYEIYIGASGWNPPRYGNGVMRTIFTISSNDASTHGIMPHVDGVDNGLYIGFDPLTNEWIMQISGNRFQYYWARMISDNPVTNLTHIGYDPTRSLNPPKLFLNTGAGFINNTGNAGLSTPVNCFSTVAGDFDNDMDVDIYMACQHPPENLPNILYENQGDGTFIAVPDAGGAAGSSDGGANNVAVADYDLDGFLDLYVINGSGEPPLTDGPDQLFHNIGNSNNWIEIDLEGVNSNRDGVGAKIYVTAGGKTQLREQNNAVHTWAQSHQRVHFGLADNTVIDNITIEWPNGYKQEINKVSANQILHVLEPSTPNLTGKPYYAAGQETGVFLWKNAFDEPYHLRIIGEGVRTNYEIRLLSTKDIVNATPVKTEYGDIWRSYGNAFELYSKLISYEDGIDFKLAGGAKSLISVLHEGKANPRLLNIGLNRQHVTPAGWIMPTAQIPRRLDFTTSKTGLYFGTNLSGDVFEVYPQSNSTIIDYELDVIADNPTVFTAVNKEPNDLYINSDKHALLKGYIGSGFDGIDTELSNIQMIGVAYKQDSVLPVNTINPGNFIKTPYPDAYWVPVMTPYDAPEIAPWRENKIFLWKNKISGLWEIMFTAGYQSRSFSGSISSDTDIINLQPVNIEDNDIIDISDPRNIRFNLFMSSGGKDGFTFAFPEGANIQLNITEPTNANHLVLIGKKRWPVLNLPVDISGW